jgi:hypothetical protein
MPRTVIPVTNVPADYAIAPQAVVWTALDATLGGSFASTGRELVLVRNTNATARTATLKSVADPFGRSGDSVSASLAQNDHTLFQRVPQSGWMQSTGVVNIDVSGLGIEALVMRLPY